jgi:hypothetical protein
MTCSIEMQYGHAAWMYGMDMWHGYAAWTCGMDMRHGQLKKSNKTVPTNKNINRQFNFFLTKRDSFSSVFFLNKMESL